MMRYQKVSPDVLLLSNGKKLSLRTCKEEDAIPDYVASEGKSLPRARPASESADPSSTSDCHNSFPSEPLLAQCDQRPSSTKAQNNHHRFEVNGFGADVGGGTGLLQWGQNKRSRGSRADDRSAGDESSANSRHKIPRRSVSSSEMPPPPCGLYTRDANPRSLKNKNIKDGSSDLTLSGKRSPRVLPENAQKPTAKAAQNGCAAAAAGVYVTTESSKRPFEREMGSAGEKINLDKFEWPRIYISLSRKEKEDDFLAMKGTKLPHRPKKRPKNVEKALQYCFPGMWLSDLTIARYEVREKKCAKKRKLGLRAMESLNSDSE